MTNKIPTTVCDDSHAEHLRSDVQDVLAVAEAMTGTPESRAHAAEVIKARLAAPAQGAAAAIAAADERRASPPAAVGATRQFEAPASSSPPPTNSPPPANDLPSTNEQQSPAPPHTGDNNIGSANLKQD